MEPHLRSCALDIMLISRANSPQAGRWARERWQRRPASGR